MLSLVKMSEKKEQYSENNMVILHSSFTWFFYTLVKVSDFVTCASCIFCAQFCLWDAKFLFQLVPGCNSIADLSLRIVFWTHRSAVGLFDMGNSESLGPISPKL